MTNKLYMKIGKILKENKFILSIILIMLLNFIEFPYYINAPGGIVNLDKKIVIDNEYKSKGTLNMAYVTEYRANIFTLLYAYLNPNFDIYKAEDYLAPSDTYETMSYRDSLELENALDNAIILGYTKAGEKVDVKSNDMYVTYIYSEADTDIEIKDKIVKINEEDVYDLKSVKNIIGKYDVGEKLDIEVTNDNKTYHRYAYIKEEDGFKYVGIYITQDKEYDVERNIKLKFKNNESGPSGGLMLTLEIYNELTSDDITHGKKIVGTGTIDEDGNVGVIGGVKYKLKAAVKNKADIFLVPVDENYEEAMEEKDKNNYKIEIIPISTLDEALEYLNNLTY